MQNKDGSIDVTVTGASLYNQKGELFAPTLMGNGATTLSPTLPREIFIYQQPIFKW